MPPIKNILCKKADKRVEYKVTLSPDVYYYTTIY